MEEELERWGPRVFRFALRLTLDRHLAEDLTQDTLLRAWNNRSSLRDAAALGMWLFRIASNLWRDSARRLRSPVGGAEPLAVDPPARLSEGDEPDRQEVLALVARTMDSLPDRQREVLYLNAYEGLSSAEIGSVLGISAEAVRSSLRVARRTMRQRVGHLVSVEMTEKTT